MTARKKTRRSHKLNDEASVITHPAPAPIAVTIRQAAQMVGISRASFYNLYIRTGRVKSVALGRQLRVISVDDLRASFAQLQADK